MKANVMKRAWEIKKQDSRNIFSICLEMAWEEIKKGAKKMVELIGSEKQIKWAKEIREEITTKLNKIINAELQVKPEQQSLVDVTKKEIKEKAEEINAIEDAAKIIKLGRKITASYFISGTRQDFIDVTELFENDKTVAFIKNVLKRI